jgi:hypothetical protein
VAGGNRAFGQPWEQKIAAKASPYSVAVRRGGAGRLICRAGRRRQGSREEGRQQGGEGEDHQCPREVGHVAVPLLRERFCRPVSIGEQVAELVHGQGAE